MLKHYVKHSYHSSPIKISQSSPDSVRIQGPSNIQLWPLIQSLLSKNAIERVENIKCLWLLQSPVPNLQASPRVEAIDRHKQAHPPFLLVERFKWKLHQGLSDSRGMGVVDRPVRRVFSHSNPPSSRKFLTQSLE